MRGRMPLTIVMVVAKLGCIRTSTRNRMAVGKDLPLEGSA